MQRDPRNLIFKIWVTCWKKPGLFRLKDVTVGQVTSLIGRQSRLETSPRRLAPQGTRVEKPPLRAGRYWLRPPGREEELLGAASVWTLRRTGLRQPRLPLQFRVRALLISSRHRLALRQLFPLIYALRRFLRRFLVVYKPRSPGYRGPQGFRRRVGRGRLVHLAAFVIRNIGNFLVRLLF